MSEPDPHIMDEIQLRHRVAQWLAIDPDEATSAELRALLDADDLTALRSLFTPRLEFGTAGMRGIRGAGPARMNRLLIRLVTLATAQILRQYVPDADTRGVGHAAHVSDESVRLELLRQSFEVAVEDRHRGRPVAERQ